MKEIKRLNTAIAQKHETIARLNTDLANAGVQAVSGDQHDAQLEALHAELRDIRARAYVAGKPADTKTLDAKIATVAEQAKAAKELAAAARDANAIIERGIALEEAELDSLLEQVKTAIRDEIIARHDTAAERYAAAVTDLGKIVAELTGAERAWKHVSRMFMTETGGGMTFPRRGLRVLDDIREKGLKVPVSASRLVDPKVAAEYGEHYQNYWYVPAWAHPRTLGFGDAQAAEIIDGLVKAGVDTTPFEQYVAPPPERKLKVRVKRGVVRGEPKVDRDPESDKVLASEEVEWALYDDFLICESEARRLQKAGIVAVHGEDELPTPRPPGVQGTVNAALPEKKDRHDWSPKPLGEYAGHYHKVDLSHYPD